MDEAALMENLKTNFAWECKLKVNFKKQIKLNFQAHNFQIGQQN
jgi:hypothetical protein